jgi:4'-phosphopantetheinyl transferase
MTDEQGRRRTGTWERAPESLALGADHVDVWRVAVGLPLRRLASLWAVLAADERTRAEAFRMPGDRDRFVVGRGVLRTVLGGYLRREPAQLHFACDTHGKPTLVGTAAAGRLRFNVSHSEGLVLVAVASDADVGVDVQWIRPELSWDKIAGRFFSPVEAAALRALPPETAREAFFACWTRKEAYVKARGEGLQRSFERFTVSVMPGETHVALREDGDPDVASSWSLQTLEVGRGYAAALAVNPPGRRLRRWEWS